MFPRKLFAEIQYSFVKSFQGINYKMIIDLWITTFPRLKLQMFAGATPRKTVFKDFAKDTFKKCHAFFKSSKQIFQIPNSKLLSWTWIWKSCLLLWAGNSNFKFRIVIWNYFFGDLTYTSHFLKRSYLRSVIQNIKTL